MLSNMKLSDEDQSNNSIDGAPISKRKLDNGSDSEDEAVFTVRKRRKLLVLDEEDDDDSKENVPLSSNTVSLREGEQVQALSGSFGLTDSVCNFDRNSIVTASNKVHVEDASSSSDDEIPLIQLSSTLRAVSGGDKRDTENGVHETLQSLSKKKTKKPKVPNEENKRRKGSKRVKKSEEEKVNPDIFEDVCSDGGSKSAKNKSKRRSKKDTLDLKEPKQKTKPRKKKNGNALGQDDSHNQEKDFTISSEGDHIQDALCPEIPEPTLDDEEMCKPKQKKRSSKKNLMTPKEPKQKTERLKKKKNTSEPSLDEGENHEENSEICPEGPEELALDDDEIYFPKEKRKGRQKKEPKPKKETKKELKEKDEELLEIYSESQRLLRETSVKLPYYRPEKCSLEDFLKTREKGYPPTTPSVPITDTKTQIISLVSEVHNDKMNVGSSEINDTSASKLGELYSSTSETAENSTKNSESSDGLNLESEHNTESCALFDSPENILRETKEKSENIPDLLDSAYVSATSSNTSDGCTDEQSCSAFEAESCAGITECNSVSVNAEKSTVHDENEVALTPSNNAPDNSDLVEKKRKLLKEKIVETSKHIRPCLPDYSTDEFIDLELDTIEDGCSKKSNLEIFINKFVVHKEKLQRKKQEPHDIKLSIVAKKDGEAGGLELSEIHVGATNCPETDEIRESLEDAKGYKLLKLKKLLFEKITVKKEASLEKRREMELMDNEAGLDEEEEAELTDLDSDSDDGDNKEPDEVREMQKDSPLIETDNEGNDDDDSEDDSVWFAKSSKKSKANIFIDDEADVEDDDYDFGESDAASCNSDPVLSPGGNADDNDDLETCSKRDDQQNEETQEKYSRLLYLESDTEDGIQKENTTEKSFADLDTSIPCNQLAILKRPGDMTADLDSTLNCSETGKMQTTGSQLLWSSQDDAVHSKGSAHLNESVHSKPSSFGGNSFPSSSFSGRVDDILSLCSGRFSNSSNILETQESSGSSRALFSQDLNSSKSQIDYKQSGNSSVSKVSSRIDDLKNCSQGNVEDLVGLCSGNFADSQLVSHVEESNSILVRESPEIEEDTLTKDKHTSFDLDSGDDDDDFEMSLSKKKSKILPPISDDNDSGDDFTKEDLDGNVNVENGYSHSEEEVDAGELDLEDADYINENDLKGFLEDEAELSGSDVGSDEEEGPEENDGYLEDLIEDNVQYSEEELKNQVGKMHFKEMLDEDKRQLRLYQELYLEDGELHSDGPGRQRKFMWRNSSNNFELHGVDGLNSDSDKEETPEDDEKWRLERHEREKWLRECNKKEGNAMEHSPVKVVVRKSLKLEIANKVEEKDQAEEAVTEWASSKGSNDILNVAEKTSTGSLLARGQNYLSGLAKKLKNLEEDTAGSRTTKHFVFRAKSPQKGMNRPKPTSTSVSQTAAPQPSKAVQNLQSTRKKGEKKRRSVFDFMNAA